MSPPADVGGVGFTDKYFAQGSHASRGCVNQEGGYSFDTTVVQHQQQKHLPARAQRIDCGVATNTAD